MAETSIEWAHFTYNPWIGCTKVSPACDHCYAETQNNHRKWAEGWGSHAARKRTKTRSNLQKWDKKAGELGVRYRVFCASLADIGDNHRSIDPEWRRQLVEDIRQYTNLDFLLLTKRPQNMPKLYPDLMEDWPRNAWIGTTVENQVEADRRIPHLLKLPAHLRFLSVEPLLGTVDLTGWFWGRSTPCGHCTQDGDCECGFKLRWEFEGEPTLDWVIVGGETGKDARPMHPDWVRSIRDQCADAGVPFLMKQWGDWLPWEPEHGPSLISQNGKSEYRHVLFPSDIDNDPKWDDGLSFINEGLNHAAFQKVGKKVAGRLLDGVLHNEYPKSGDER